MQDRSFLCSPPPRGEGTGERGTYTKTIRSTAYLTGFCVLYVLPLSPNPSPLGGGGCVLCAVLRGFYSYFRPHFFFFSPASAALCSAFCLLGPFPSAIFS